MIYLEDEYPQGGEAWQSIRCGKVTASKITDIMAKLKSGKPSAGRIKYMGDLIAERLTGVKSDSFSNTAMQWGVETEPPKSILTSMSITIGSKDVFVSQSAYCGLANPYEICLTENNKGFSITIFGGQTAASYKAEIIVQDGYIQRRKVSHGEFPNVAWEETVYSYNLIDN